VLLLVSDQAGADHCEEYFGARSAPVHTMPRCNFSPGMACRPRTLTSRPQAGRDPGPLPRFPPLPPGQLRWRVPGRPQRASASAASAAAAVACITGFDHMCVVGRARHSRRLSRCARKAWVPPCAACTSRARPSTVPESTPASRSSSTPSSPPSFSLCLSPQTALGRDCEPERAARRVFVPRQIGPLRCLCPGGRRV
jgi:hypothetical protein